MRAGGRGPRDWLRHPFARIAALHAAHGTKGSHFASRRPPPPGAHPAFPPPDLAGLFMSSRAERSAAGSVVIDALDADRAESELRALVGLLKDAVDSGASVGYLPPLAAAEGEVYWRGVVEDVRRGSCVLLGAREADGTLVGTAQLLPAIRHPSRSWRRAP